jgi:hypothetical protein
MKVLENKGKFPANESFQNLRLGKDCGSKYIEIIKTLPELNNEYSSNNSTDEDLQKNKNTEKTPRLKLRVCKSKLVYFYLKILL